MRLAPVGLLAWCLAAAGCGGPNAPLSAPGYDADAMTRSALDLYDKNGNGTIEGAELDGSPALKSALTGIDTNKDKKLSADELKARFEAYRGQAAGIVGVAVTVTQDGSPLPGAELTFTPEPFMGDTVGEATARTGDDGGVTGFTVRGESAPGLPCGMYRVKVSKPGPNGQETIPARFNAQTTLGCEVFTGRTGTRLDFNLPRR